MVQKSEKYACTHLDMDNNASSQRCIKWTVNNSIQAFWGGAWIWGVTRFRTQHFAIAVTHFVTHSGGQRAKHSAKTHSSKTDWLQLKVYYSCHHSEPMRARMYTTRLVALGTGVCMITLTIHFPITPVSFALILVTEEKCLWFISAGPSLNHRRVLYDYKDGNIISCCSSYIWNYLYCHQCVNNFHKCDSVSTG